VSKPGAKTKYRKSFIKKVDEYLNSRRDRVGEHAIKVKLPTIEDFANYLGVSRKSLYNWEKEYPQFAYALEKILNEQLRRLINNGLAGTYNSTIAKLMLSSNHDMRERIDATSKGESLNKFDDKQIDRIADRIASRERSDGDTSG
jgi:hypothetical protein